jgi:maltose O-acetyltransferase
MKWIERLKIENYNYAIGLFHTVVNLLPPSLRRLIWKLALSELGKRAIIGEKAYLHYPWKIKIGDDVLIAPGARIFPSYQYQDCFVEIRDRALIGPNLTIYGAGHPLVNPRTNHIAEPVIIEEDTYIGGSVTIRYGVTIGFRSVVAAGSVVTKDVAAFSVVGGNPARVIGTVPKNGEE